MTDTTQNATTEQKAQKTTKFGWPEPQSFIAVFLVISVVALTFTLVLTGKAESQMTIMMIGGLMTVGFASIIGFYYGSSKSSKTKDDTISTLAGNPAPAGAPMNTSVPDVTKVASVLALCVIAGTLAFGMRDAHADSRRGNIVTTITADVSAFLTGLADIQGAITLSTEIPGLQDPVGSACWSQLAPVQALIKAHPLPVTLKVASDIEALRLAALAMNQVCANPNCGQMFLDATNAAAAISSVPIPVTLTSLCSKVPVMGTTVVPVNTISPAAKP